MIKDINEHSGPTKISVFEWSPSSSLMDSTKHRRLIAVAAAALLVLGSCAGSTSGAPTNLAGEWTLAMDPDFRGNYAVSFCKIDQDCNKLSVVCAGGDPRLHRRFPFEAMGGDVRGTSVTWWLTPRLGE